MRCTRYLWILTLFMIGFPITYLIFASFIFELHSKGILLVALSPLFYLSSFFWIVSGFGLRRMQQWSWYTFLAAMVFITYLNALNLISYSESQFKGFAFDLTLLIQLYVYIAVRREIHVPYLFPQIRWWESGLAGMNQLPVQMVHVSSHEGVSSGQILDISLKGCFIKSPLEFEAFEKIRLQFAGFGHEIDIAGLVVWNAKSTVTHPKGIGVQFQKMDRKKKRKLRIISQRFKKGFKKHERVSIRGPESSKES